MCEPSPPALHLHANGNVTMVGVGVKREEEESGDGGGVREHESQQSSPSCDWSARQLAERGDGEKPTPLGSRSPLVKLIRLGRCFRNLNFTHSARVHKTSFPLRIPLKNISTSDLFS